MVDQNGRLFYLKYSFENFSHRRSLMIFHSNLSDSKSPHVSRTLLSIMVDLHKTLVCIVSTCALISSSCMPFPISWRFVRWRKLQSVYHFSFILDNLFLVFWQDFGFYLSFLIFWFYSVVCCDSKSTIRLVLFFFFFFFVVDYL